MKTKLILAILITAAVTATLTAVVARQEASSDDHVVTRVQSRELLVYLPESYEQDATRRYPVLYVLDGASQAAHTANSARLMARIDDIPEVIVVGIPNGGDERRERDYTPPYMRTESANGEADRFLSFLESNVIPHIDRTYRTTATRMLAGNSRGGLFVVYSLIAKPDLFSARFAYSPALWRDNDRIVTELAKARLTRPTFLYLSLGDRENEKMTRAFNKTTSLLRTSPPPELRWRADLTKGATHHDNAMLSTPVGLHECFGALQVGRMGVRRNR